MKTTMFGRWDLLFETVARWTIRFFLRPLTYCAASPLILSGAIFSSRPYRVAVSDSYHLLSDYWDEVLTYAI